MLGRLGLRRRTIDSTAWALSTYIELIPCTSLLLSSPVATLRSSSHSFTLVFLLLVVVSINTRK